MKEKNGYRSLDDDDRHAENRKICQVSIRYHKMESYRGEQFKDI